MMSCCRVFNEKSMKIGEHGEDIMCFLLPYKLGAAHLYFTLHVHKLAVKTKYKQQYIHLGGLSSCERTCFNHARNTIRIRSERKKAGKAAKVAKLISLALRIWSSSSIALCCQYSDQLE